MLITFVVIHTKDGKQEILAMKTKVVCLIQMNQFEEAIKFISTTPEIQELVLNIYLTDDYNLVMK